MWETAEEYNILIVNYSSFNIIIKLTKLLKYYNKDFPLVAT